MSRLPSCVWLKSLVSCSQHQRTTGKRVGKKAQQEAADAHDMDQGTPEDYDDEDDDEEGYDDFEDE